MLARRYPIAAAALLSAALPVALQAAPSAPTFYRDVAPILYQNCVACHQPNQAAPFSLITYTDAKRHATQIVGAVRRRYMPPWLPQGEAGQFTDERHLSDQQIATIANWVAAGSAEGTPADAPPPPSLTPEGWQLGQPDLIVTASSSFLVPADGRELFWNFTLKPALAQTRYIRAIEIRPAMNLSIAGQLVHHANLLIDRTGSSARLEKSRGSGFPGMELTLNRNPLDPLSHFLFWKPGNIPQPEPDGLSWRLDPGNTLVLNTHLQPRGRAERIQPSVGLYFTDRPPTRFPLLLELERDDALNIPAGTASFRVRDDFRLPLDVDLLAIYPHAHYLGKQLEAYATLPDRSRRWLIRIPDWNLTWQSVYRYREPVFLPKGTLISMRFSYDNSAANVRNPNRPPRPVEAGNLATDEMAHLWLQVLPRGRGDQRRVLEEALLLHRLEKAPWDFQAHLNLGALRLSRLHTQEAIVELQTAIRLNPSSAEAHDMLGSAMRSLGRVSDAASEYRLALRSDPNHIDARYNLATLLARSGRFTEAVAYFRPVLEAFPDSSRLHNEFGLILAASGDLTGALAQFDRALALDPASQDAQRNRASLQQRLPSAGGKRPLEN